MLDIFNDEPDFSKYRDNYYMEIDLWNLSGGAQLGSLELTISNGNNPMISAFEQ